MEAILIADILNTLFKGIVSLSIGVILFLLNKLHSRNKEVDQKHQSLENSLQEMDKKVLQLNLESIKRDDLTGAISRNRIDFLEALDKQEKLQRERDENERKLIRAEMSNLTSKLDDFHDKFSDLTDLVKEAIKNDVR